MNPETMPPADAGATNTSAAATRAATTGAGDGDVLLRVENLVKYFPIQSGQLIPRRKDFVHAVDDVSLEVRHGKTLGLVGETGSGKSTLARCVARLYDITSGRIVFDGHDISTISARTMPPFPRHIQTIFQDPYGSLNPRRRGGSIIRDPFSIHHTPHRAARRRRGAHLTAPAGLHPHA